MGVMFPVLGVPGFDESRTLNITFTASSPGQIATLQRITPSVDSTIFWGDGDSTALPAGNTSSKAHTYAAAGTYVIRVTNYNTITYISVNSDTKIKITATLSNLPRGMTCLNVYSTSSSITGTLANLPSGMIILHVSGTSSSITGSLADLPSGMTQLHVYSTSSSITGGATPMAARGIQQFRLENCGMPQANINDIIARLYTDRASKTYATPVLNVGGTNAAPSASPHIDTYIPALTAAGYTVTYTAP